jgi:Zn finger protein HypA/HybF involved in hydrogenase expression
LPKNSEGETFEQVMESMSGMSAAQTKAKINELDGQCICNMCPSFMGTGEEKLTFCMIGRSSIIKEENGCICPGCPVQSDLALRWDYYCTKGSGRQLSRK